LRLMQLQDHLEEPRVLELNSFSGVAHLWAQSQHLSLNRATSETSSIGMMGVSGGFQTGTAPDQSSLESKLSSLILACIESRWSETAGLVHDISFEAWAMVSAALRTPTLQQLLPELEQHWIDVHKLTGQIMRDMEMRKRFDMTRDVIVDALKVAGLPGSCLFLVCLWCCVIGSLWWMTRQFLRIVMLPLRCIGCCFGCGCPCSSRRKDVAESKRHASPDHFFIGSDDGQGSRPPGSSVAQTLLPGVLNVRQVGTSTPLEPSPSQAWLLAASPSTTAVSQLEDAGSPVEVLQSCATPSPCYSAPCYAEAPAPCYAEAPAPCYAQAPEVPSFYFAAPSCDSTDVPPSYATPPPGSEPAPEMSPGTMTTQEVANSSAATISPYHMFSKDRDDVIVSPPLPEPVTTKISILDSRLDRIEGAIEGIHQTSATSPASVETQMGGQLKRLEAAVERMMVDGDSRADGRLEHIQASIQRLAGRFNQEKAASQTSERVEHIEQSMQHVLSKLELIARESGSEDSEGTEHPQATVRLLRLLRLQRLLRRDPREGLPEWPSQEAQQADNPMDWSSHVAQCYAKAPAGDVQLSAFTFPEMGCSPCEKNGITRQNLVRMTTKQFRDARSVALADDQAAPTLMVQDG